MPVITSKMKLAMKAVISNPESSAENPSFLPKTTLNPRMENEMKSKKKRPKKQRGFFLKKSRKGILLELISSLAVLLRFFIIKNAAKIIEAEMMKEL